MADGWKVTGQKQDVILNPNGTGFTDVWVISYQVTDGASRGTIGTVSVPEADHNADYIRQAINDKVAQIHDIANL